MWLLRLRIIVALFLLAAVFSAEISTPVPAINGPMSPLFAAALLLLVTSALFSLRMRKGRPLGSTLLGAVLLLDVVTLSVVLALTGGAANPYSVLYLVQIVVAAVLLGERWTWAMCAVCVSAFGLQFLFLGTADHGAMGHGAGEHFSSHLQGMWSAFAIAATLVATFVCRILADLRKSDAAASAMRLRIAESERFASIATLAAGTAHELGTPLNTIMVIADDLISIAEDGGVSSEIREDLGLLKLEVRRCKSVLDEMRLQADGAIVEKRAAIGAGQLVEALRKELLGEEVERVSFRMPDNGHALHIPLRGLVKVLKGLVRNAIHSAPDRSPVQVTVRAEGESCAITVEDQGSGMPAEVLERCCDPFFTTKPPGQGMGLGLFLARLFCERYDGRLEIESQPGRGSSVTLFLGEERL